MDATRSDSFEPSPRLLAVRTTLAASAAELRGDWDRVEFLARTVSLLPSPEEVAWAAMFLAVQNLALVEPAPDPDELAAAGALSARHRHAPPGSDSVASIVLCTAARSLLAPPRRDPAPLLVASTGPLLRESPDPSWSMSAGLFTAVSYAFVRSAMSLDADPLEKLDALLASL
jgi:hypothetical protein